MIALALETGISPSQWAEEGERAILTAAHILEKQRQRQQQQRR